MPGLGVLVYCTQITHSCSHRVKQSMNVNVIACVSGNYSHLNWKWSNNSIPVDKQVPPISALIEDSRAEKQGRSCLGHHTPEQDAQGWSVLPPLSALWRWPQRWWQGVILASGSWLPLSLLWFRRSPDTLTFLLLGSYRSPPGHWVGCSSLLTWHFKVWDELVHPRAGWTKGLVVPYSEAAEMQSIYRAANEVFSEPTVPPGPHYKLLFSITTCVLFPMQLIDVKLQQHWYK